jgi:adenylate kinase
MRKNLLFFGPPGSGKGTQINILKEYFDLVVISTGDIARSLASNDKKIQETLDRGELLEDEVIFKAVDNKIGETGDDLSIIFDGFPRNLMQAKKLDEILLHHNRILDAAIYIYLDESEVVKRLTTRKVCSKCGQPLFNLERCPNCGGTSIIRSDDNEATIINRMQVFLERTLPLTTYYEKKNILLEINGKQSIEGVAKDIKKGLGV